VTTTGAAATTTSSDAHPARPGPDTFAGRRRLPPAIGVLTHDLPELYAEQWLGAAGRARAPASASHLITVRGRQRSGFVRGPANHTRVQGRYQGYRDASRDQGLVIPVIPDMLRPPLTANTRETAARSAQRGG
jgi:DNA-binding LacI/PurR family transcriptional regulator